jgi:hypothetical protein
VLVGAGGCVAATLVLSRVETRAVGGWPVGSRVGVAVAPAGRGVLVGVGVAVGAAGAQEPNSDPRARTAMMRSQGQSVCQVG